MDVTLRAVKEKTHRMKRFEIGDEVRIDIPDTEDPDFSTYHGRTGKISDIIEDDAGRETGDERDSYLFEVEFEEGKSEHFRWRDLRPDS